MPKPATPVTSPRQRRRGSARKGASNRERRHKPARSKEGVQRSLALSLVYEKIPLFAPLRRIEHNHDLRPEKGGLSRPFLFSRCPRDSQTRSCLMPLICGRRSGPPDWPFSIPWKPGLPLLSLASAFLLLAWTVAAVRYAGKLPYLLVGWLWYLVTLLPVIGIIKVGDACHGRSLYLYSLSSAPLSRWPGEPSISRRDCACPKAALAAASALVISACMLMTYIQIGQWKDSVTLFRHAASVTSRNFMAHNGLAVEYIDQKRYAGCPATPSSGNGNQPALCRGQSESGDSRLSCRQKR